MTHIENLIMELDGYPEKINILLFLLKKMEYTSKKKNGVNDIIERIERDNPALPKFNPFSNGD